MLYLKKPLIIVNIKSNEHNKAFGKIAIFYALANVECFLPNYRNKLWFDRLHKFLTRTWSGKFTPKQRRLTFAEDFMVDHLYNLIFPKKGIKDNVNSMMSGYAILTEWNHELQKAVTRPIDLKEGLWYNVNNGYSLTEINEEMAKNYDGVLDLRSKSRRIWVIQEEPFDKVNPAYASFIKTRRTHTDFSVATEMALKAFHSKPGQVIEAKFENGKDGFKQVIAEYQKLTELLRIPKEHFGFPEIPDRGITINNINDEPLEAPNGALKLIGSHGRGKSQFLLAHCLFKGEIVQSLETSKHSVAKRIEAILKERNEEQKLIQDTIITPREIKALLKPLPWQSNGANKGGKKNKRNRKW